MWLRYGRVAATSGARLVHSCGFDSIPYDLGALWTVNQLPDDVPIEIQGFGRIGGGPSGGSLHSAVQILARLRQGAAVARQRAPRGGDGAPGVAGCGGYRPAPPRRLAGGWVVPMPTIDPRTVLRSARVLDGYGPDFAYAQYIVTRRARRDGRRGRRRRRARGLRAAAADAEAAAAPSAGG